MKRRRGGKRFEAFTDEAGHTGLNLFDPVQPWFWTGTLLTPAPFQERGEELFRRLRASVGAPVLHAKELGLPRIEQLIAVPLKGFLEEMDVHFVLTAIEKRHLAATKLADTILDSSTNKAVSRLHYGVHGLRLMLAHMLVELMEPPDHEEFWRVYALRDGIRLRPTLVRLQESLRSRPVARRQRELLSDALGRWRFNMLLLVTFAGIALFLAALLKDCAVGGVIRFS